ncbi:hypothetical protein GIB67_024215 [Kingdonia uniflora]|uniref:Uncharacterized protein n=1 Tax=Kingdonia uniflora TaxID=39325 RepID=A0A7J7LZS3_9MAGN|nr:hypothetical protein GIB67_024215 [Kingdonia uniflora]
MVFIWSFSYSLEWSRDDPSYHYVLYRRGRVVGQVVMCFSDFLWDVSTIRTLLLIVE